MTCKQILPTMATALSLVLATGAFAADEYNVANGLTLNGNPLGMHGNDPVSMFEGGTPASISRRIWSATPLAYRRASVRRWRTSLTTTAPDAARCSRIC